MAGRACGFMHLLVLVAGYCWYIEGARDFRPLPMIAAGAAFLAMCMALSMEAWALAGARVGAKYGNFVTSEVRLPVLLVGFGVSPPLFRQRAFYSRATYGVARAAFAVYLITEYPPAREVPCERQGGVLSPRAMSRTSCIFSGSRLTGSRSSLSRMAILSPPAVV